ncbi:hypothetical protein ACHAWF_013817 [Thalassiosira exigua]
MCITSTARRRSLTLQVLPSHLLTTSSTSAAVATATATAAGSAASSNAAGFFAPELQPASSTRPKPLLPTRTTKKSKKPDFALHPHPYLPHHDGLVVQHHYHDHSADPIVDPTLIKHKAKGGVIIPFPVKLHSMLDKIEEDGLAHVVSWQPHGRCFVVHKPKEFVNHVMPHYFKQTKMASFQRQLNLYGFNRLTSGLDKGGYYHEMFLRGKVSLAYDIHRMRVKGTGVRLPTNPDNEPNFYALPPLTKMDPANMPPLPPPKEVPVPVNMEKRRAELLRESHSHFQKIAMAKTQKHRRRQNPRQQKQDPTDPTDVVYFEGLPFHYLDPSALPSTQESSSPRRQLPQLNRQSVSPVLEHKAHQRPAMAHSSSIVSESDSDEDAFLPSFSPSNMDWDGPLSSPSIRAHMRRSSFQSFAKDTSLAAPSFARPPEEDIEVFFQGLDMPVDMYHNRIEQMDDDDDTAFGYLLEQAITE